MDLKVNFPYTAIYYDAKNEVRFYEAGTVPNGISLDNVRFDVCVGGNPDGTGKHSIMVGCPFVAEVTFHMNAGVTPEQAVMLFATMVGMMETASEEVN